MIYQSEEEIPFIGKGNINGVFNNLVDKEEEEEDKFGISLDIDDDTNEIPNNTDYENAPFIGRGNSYKPIEIDESSIPFVNEITSPSPNFTVENLAKVGPNSTLVNLPEYILSKAKNRGKASDIATYYYKNDLTKEDILEDPVMMDIIRSSLEARYSDSIVSQGYGLVSAGLGAPMGGLGRDYRSQSNEKVFETWQNWMRLLNSLNSVTVANEVSAGLLANDDERSKMGAGYYLMSRMDNAFVGRGTWREMGDAMWDYTRGAIHDPLNLVTFGLGKILFGTGQKLAAEGVKRTALAFYKNQLNKGVAPEIARQKLVKSLASKELLGTTAAFTLPDLAQNVTLDLLSQLNLINVGNQEEISKSQTTIAAFASLFIPAVTITNFGLRELRKKEPIKSSWLGYIDIDNKVREGLKNAQQIVDERVSANADDIAYKVESHFGYRKPIKEWKQLPGGFNENLKKWEKIRGEAYNTLKESIGGNNPDAFANDLAHTQQFFREFFLDTVDNEGNILTKGYLRVLKEAGFVVHQDMIDESKITGVMAESMKYLSNFTVEKIMKEYEFRTGKSLNLPYTVEALSARYVNIESNAGRTLQISQAMANNIHKETKNMNTTMKVMAGQIETDISPKRFQWALSIYKRLLTSHPATTGSNLKGFGALNLLDVAGDITTSVGNITLSAFYKTLGGNAKKAEYHARQAYGNFFGAARKGFNVLNPEMDVGYARLILDLNPKVKERLFRDVSGDGGAFDSLALFNLDKKNNPIYAGFDSITKGAQTISLMRLQDEYSKLWAFSGNMNQNIMKVYGESPTQFFSRPDVGIEITSPKFMDEVLQKSAWRTMRQTASVNWSQLQGRAGNSLFREGAILVENVTNRTAGGFIIPFGSFMNTVAATFGDVTGINAARYMTRKALGRDLDPETQDFTEATSKMIVGWSYVLWRTFYGENSAVEKVSRGDAYNENRNSEGDLVDITYDWPLNQADLIAQMLAHAISGDGRNLKKDLAERNPDEIYEYIIEHFDVTQIPTGLQARLGAELTGSAVRQVDQVTSYIGEQFYSFVDGETQVDSLLDLFNFIIGLTADAGARIFQGGTRFLEPVNVVANMVRFDGATPDLRQGNERTNSAFKYINALLPTELSSAATEETRATLGEGKDRVPNVSKMLFGARRSPHSNIGIKMLNAAGIPTWKFNRWGGDPIVKNAMDNIAAPIFEQIAMETLEKYPNYFQRDLNVKVKIINEIIKPKLREMTLEVLRNSSPKSLSILRDITIGDKDAMNYALNVARQGNIIGADDEFDDIMKKENATDILAYIKTIMDNYDTLTFPQPSGSILRENLAYQ
tara:strand:- start:25260 stop:29231 length:3972 start_codon:yes stop_codon:yes gene_type:complete